MKIYKNLENRNVFFFNNIYKKTMINFTIINIFKKKISNVVRR